MNRRSTVLALVLLGLGLLIGAGLTATVAVDTAGEVDSVEQSLIDIPPVNPIFPEQDSSGSEEVKTLPPNPVTRFDQLGATERRPNPVSLEIEAIGVAAPVQPYGVNPRSGEMVVPRNVTEVAWYQHGPSPGESGSAVLAAHVDLAGQGKGVFFNLKKLEPGDSIIIGYEDGTARSFQVAGLVVYRKSELPVSAIFSRQGPPVLTLVTCGGGFSKSRQSYDSNVVVYAVPTDAVASALPAA
jgi:LPXTG-site transpeptidase (sortase) family protein